MQDPTKTYLLVYLVQENVSVNDCFKSKTYRSQSFENIILIYGLIFKA